MIFLPSLAALYEAIASGGIRVGDCVVVPQRLAGPLTEPERAALRQRLFRLGAHGAVSLLDAPVIVVVPNGEYLRALWAEGQARPL